MKRAVIVHCWGGTPDYCWYPWVKNQLEAQGFMVDVPAMPETDVPKLKLWLPKLMQTIGQPDEELYLIGHSIGVATILRYLEQLPKDQKIASAVLVAGFTNDLSIDELKNFYETPLDFTNIRSHTAKGFYNIHSDNDPYVPLANSQDLQDKLGGEAIILHNKGHFSGATDETPACTELPEVIKAVTHLLAN